MNHWAQFASWFSGGQPQLDRLSGIRPQHLDKRGLTLARAPRPVFTRYLHDCAARPLRKINQSKKVVPIAEEDATERKPRESLVRDCEIPTEIVLHLRAQDGTQHPVVKQTRGV